MLLEFIPGILGNIVLMLNMTLGLLGSGFMRPRLDLALGSSVQERCGSDGNGLEEGLKIIRVGTTLILPAKAKRVGVV